MLQASRERSQRWARARLLADAMLEYSKLRGRSKIKASLVASGHQPRSFRPTDRE